MASGGLQPNRGGRSGSATWISSSGDNQWNFNSQTRRDSDLEDWNQTRHNISNNLDWQTKKSSHGTGNKNKRKINTSKNSTVSTEVESREEFNTNYDPHFESNAQQTRQNIMGFQRTKFTTSTLQNGLNDDRQSVQYYQEEQPNGDGPPRSKNSPWPEVKDRKSCIKNISRNIDHLGNVQVKDNVSQLPNANQILERLMQVREYMKEVACMIEKLHNSGDHRVIERIRKLEKIYGDLQHSEQQLMELLDKISKNNRGQIVKFSKLLNHLETQENECLNVLQQFVEIQNAQASQSLETKSLSESGESGDDRIYESEEFNHTHLNQIPAQNEMTVENTMSVQIARRNDLLKKVMESQEKLKALEEQQASLIALQNKAENRLAQVKSTRNSNHEDVTPIELETSACRSLQDDIGNLQERLDSLKNIYDSKQFVQGHQSFEGDTKAVECETERHWQELQVKLQDLQEKKSYMDNLLQELKTLQTVRSQDGMNNEIFTGRMKDGACASTTAKQTLEMAQEVLQSIDTTEKFSKLKEMKERLRHLEDLIVSHQPGQECELAEFLENTTSIQSNSSLPQSTADLPKKCRNQTESQIRKTESQKKDNLCREHNNDFKAANLMDANSNQVAKQELKYDGDDHIENVNWDTNDPLAEFRKLQMAKDKLSRLQELLTVLKDPRGVTGERAEIVQQMLENLDEEDESQNSFIAQGLAYSEQFRAPPTTDGTSESTFDENVPKDRNRQSEFSSVMRDQSVDIDHLFEESQRLLGMQDFTNLNPKHPNNSNNKPVALPSLGNRAVDHSRSTGNRPVEHSRSTGNLTEVRDGPRSQLVTAQPPKHNRENECSTARAKTEHTNKNSIHQVATAKHARSDMGDVSSGEFVTPNHEIWSEVRQRFILKEELRQKKKELEELMKKDKGKSNSRNQDNMSDNVSYSNKSETLGLSYVGTEGTTVATWGGSTQGNLDEDQDGENESQEDMEDEAEENEAYSSEEICPCAESASSGLNNSHYVGNSHVVDHKTDGKTVDVNASVEKMALPKIPPAQKPNPECKDGRNTWEKVPLTRDTVHIWNRHSNLQQPERQKSQVSETAEQSDQQQGPRFRPEVVQPLWQQQASQFLQQLEQTNSLHSSVMRDQNYLVNMLQQMNHLNTSASMSPSSETNRTYYPEMIHHLTQQLQQQQQLINLHQCHHLLYMQQVEIQQLQRQVVLDPSPHTATSDETVTHMSGAAVNPTESAFHPSVPPTWLPGNGNQIPPTPVAPNSSGSMENRRTGTVFPPSAFLGQEQIDPGAQTLNNQVAPGIRTNNYWDNFRSYSRQNLLSAASGNKNSGDNVVVNSRTHAATLMQNRPLTTHDLSAPPPSADSSVRPRDGSSQLPLFQRREDVADSPDFHRIGHASDIPRLDLDVLATNKGRPRKDKVNQNNHQKTETKPTQQMTQGLASSRGFSPRSEKYKPGLSSGISGTAYAVNTTSASSSATSVGSGARDGMVAFLANSQDQQLVSNESDDVRERSLFEILRESIYSEVALLISQNETRPHYLIQMFKELQKLNSDYLRQNALISISELISNSASVTVSFSSPQSGAGNMARRQGVVERPWIEGGNNFSEVVASESVATSDEDEARKARIFKMSRATQKGEGAVSKCANQQSHFDYVELADSGDTVSSVSTSTDQQFTSSVAETLIHVNKIKEVNQQKQKTFFTPNSNSSPIHSTTTAISQMDEVSNSIVDPSSEPSISETLPMRYSELDSKQLDDRIQTIMLEVVPFLKAHLDDICSAKLLSCLQQLVISLVTQRDEGKELTHLFRKRLVGSLQATVAKYTGKKLRDCGEDLLVDTSEVLFGELAFVQLVQNIDDVNNARGKLRTYHAISQPLPSVGDLAENALRREAPEGIKKFSPNNSFPCVDGEVTDADECLSKMEDDELGQSRDDVMAANCDIFDNEDASRPSSGSPLKDSVANEHRRTTGQSPLLELQPDGAVAASASVSALPVNEVSSDRSDQRQNQNVEINGQLPSCNEIDIDTEECLEDNQDLAEADQPQNLSALERLSTQPHVPMPAEGIVHDSALHSNEETARSEATEDDRAQRQENNNNNMTTTNSNNVEECNETQAMGADGGLEQGLDEVPIKLRPLFQCELNVRRAEEESQNNLVDEILNDSVEAELAENPNPIRQPDTQ